MRLKRCENGHLFDADQGSVCPFCADDKSAPVWAPEKPSCPPADALTSVSLPAGLEDYCVNEMLGQGSTGAVYRISKKVPDQYAVKVISWDRPGGRELALREYRTGLLFSACPNTIHVLHYYEQSRTSFIQQELAEPLMQHYCKCRPAVGDVLRAALDICAALTAVHEKGYQHYDVKPSSLFLADGTVKLGDFSHCLPSSPGTAHRHMLGTYQFAAPEIVSGGPCSGREDIYSFGVCLYIMLTGRHPFPLEGRTPPVREREDRLCAQFLHPDLLAVVEKAAAYDPRDRYATIDQAAAAIRSLAERLGDMLLEPAPFACEDDSDRKTSTGISAGSADSWDREIYSSVALQPEAAKAAREAAAPPAVDEVQFTVVAEKTARQAETRIVEIAMYTPEQKQQAITEIQQEFDEQILQKSSHPLRAERGARITVTLSAQGIELFEEKLEYRWTGSYLRFSFGYYIPEDYSRRQILFRANVYFEGVLATTLLCPVNVDKAEDEVPYTRQDVRSAFLSYAREDTEAVTYIIQTLKKIRPDLDIFFDLEKLRSGEDWELRLYSEIRKRDRLFLCWSRAAARSPWVEREWRCMADTKGVEAIEPFPLEDPDQCPVPEPLQKLCFADLEVLIRRAKMLPVSESGPESNLN